MHPYASELILGVDDLIDQVAAMVARWGDPKDFDAARWMGHWLNQPLPALDGRRPADYLDTMEGQRLVSNLITTAVSGAYV